MKVVIDTDRWNELESACWGIDDGTPEGERLRAALIEAMLERELVEAKFDEAKAN